MFGEDADQAFAHALRAHKVSAETAQIAVRVMRKLGLGQAPTEGDAQQVDQPHELDAADRAIGRPWQSPPSGGWADRMAEGGLAMGAPEMAQPTAPQPKPFGPDLPDVKPRAIEFLLKHPETAAAFDREYAQPGLAKKVLEKYSAATGAAGSLMRGAP
jgi:hypothetical protein